MKTERQKAENIAHNYLRQRAINVGAKLKVDKRTRVGRLALQIIYEITPTYNFNEVREKRRERSRRKSEAFTNVYSSPLVKDYLSNKNSIIKIFPDHIQFYGRRNHWAKTEKDLKILEILSKK